MKRRASTLTRFRELGPVRQGLAALLLLITLAHPIGLLFSPPGFFVDEAVGAANIISVRETGKNLHGQSLPVYTLAAGGGFVTPTYLYSGVAWSSIFGDSEYAFRAHSLFYTILAVILLMLVAYWWWGVDGALATGFVSTLIPWSWHQGQLAWDPALIPFYISLSLAGWSYMRQRHWHPLAWAALLAGLVGAAYSYPPTRVTLVILGPLLLLALWSQLKQHWGQVIAGLIVAALACIPLAQFSLTAEAMGRASHLAVWGPGARSLMGVSSNFDAAALAGKNLLGLSSPRFLFFNGDPNLRHGTLVGMLGYGGFVVALGAIIAFVYSLIKHRKFEAKGRDWLFLSLIVVGIIAGYLGAALTWEGQPHSLRSVAAWPFYGLLLGGLILVIKRANRTLLVFVCSLAAAAVAVNMWSYYTVYVSRAGESLDAPQRPRLINSARANRASDVQYLNDAYKYYQFRYGGE